MRGIGHSASRVASRSESAKFLVITDPHIMYVRAADGREESYIAALQDAATYGASHILQIGDFSTDGEQSVTRWQNVTAANKPAGVTLHTIIGTHDLIDGGVANGTNDAFVAAATGLVGPPFWWAKTLVFGAFRILVIGTEQIEYSTNSADPTRVNVNPGVLPGDRLGWSSGDPIGGSWRRFGPSQLSWLERTLKANRRADAVLLLVHMPPGGTTATDFSEFARIIGRDGRPNVLLSGHTHAYPTVYTNLVGPQTCLKFPELSSTGDMTGHAWTRFEIGYSNGRVAFLNAEIRGITDYASWTEVAPFTKGPTS